MDEIENSNEKLPIRAPLTEYFSITWLFPTFHTVELKDFDNFEAHLTVIALHRIFTYRSFCALIQFVWFDETS